MFSIPLNQDIDTTMIRSMTAFSRTEQSDHWGSIIWEIRSVNHRYLETSFKLPETLRQLEPQLREHLRKSLNRGKVECTLRYQLNAGESETVKVNMALAEQILQSADQLQQKITQPASFSALDLMQWPGVLEETQLDSKAMLNTAMASFRQAIEQLSDSRQREGAELAKLIEQRLEAISSIVKQVRNRLPEILTSQHQKLVDKFAELKMEVDASRLEQELVFVAQKADVAEELDRLDTHVREVGRVVKKGGACGRRLDFLMQELNREANTLSSKSIVSETTQAAVELKVLIEQMREQIQNIE